MLKGPLKLLLLAALAAGAAHLPGLLGDRLEGSRLAGVPAFPPGPYSAAGAGAGGELAGLPNLAISMAAMEEAYRRETAALSAEEREIIADAAPKLEFKSNQLTRQLGLAPGGKPGGTRPAGISTAEILRRLRSARGTVEMFTEFRYGMFKFFKRHEAAITVGLWLVPAGLALLSFLLFLCKRYTLSMAVTGFLFLVSNYLLWVLSTSVVFSAVLTRENLLAALPRQLWLSPVVFLVVSAAQLRLSDENYPFWNKTVAALASPITAACVAAGWHKGFALLKGALASRLAS